MKEWLPPTRSSLDDSTSSGSGWCSGLPKRSPSRSAKQIPELKADKTSACPQSHCRRCSQSPAHCPQWLSGMNTSPGLRWAEDGSSCPHVTIQAGHTPPPPTPPTLQMPAPEQARFPRPPTPPGHTHLLPGPSYRFFCHDTSRSSVGSLGRQWAEGRSGEHHGAAEGTPSPASWLPALRHLRLVPTCVSSVDKDSASSAHEDPRRHEDRK